MTLKHELAYRGAGLVRGFGKAADLSQGPIKLFWWTDRVNFGDALSPLIVRYLSGREVEWASLDDCALVSTGSVYGWLRLRSRRYLRDVHVWGSGLQSPQEAAGRLDYLHHHLVRGPLTAEAAGDPQLPTGDPGLLGPEAVGVVRERDARGIGIVPHVADWSRAEEIKQYQYIDDVRVIDLRSTDCAGVIQEMAACERIYSSSLHGLVLADALCIPNFRFVSRRYSVNWDFKFLDYGLSVGRDLSRPVDVTEHIANGWVGPQDTTYLSDIMSKKSEVAESFPYAVFGADRPSAFV